VDVIHARRVLLCLNGAISGNIGGRFYRGPGSFVFLAAAEFLMRGMCKVKARPTNDDSTSMRKEIPPPNSMRCTRADSRSGGRKLGIDFVGQK